MKNWTEILLKPTDPLEASIQLLESGAKRIALVVDENRKLLGTITDGDIRRALISHMSMDCYVDKIMNCNPSTALVSDSSSFIMSRMKNEDILSIPLIDKQGAVVGLETLHSLLKNKRYDNPVFLMAGGFGKRLHPLTKEKPKPLLNVGNRPILETIINRFIDAGFYNFYISTHYKADMIRDYFGDGSDKGVKIQYLHEESPLGTAGSLGLLPDNLPELPVLIMNADLLTKVNFEYLLDFHHSQGGLATMCIKRYDIQVPYGVVDIDSHSIVDIVEKPVQKFFVNAGIYVLDPKIINSVDGTSYLDMPSLLKDRISNGDKVNAFPIHEYWLDIGQESQYKEAQNNIKDFN